MNTKHVTLDRIAGLTGVALVSAFLLGLADSINVTPFWVIILLVLAAVWAGWFEEAIRRRPFGKSKAQE
ncbi:MAG: hypothetical protein ACYYKD_10955 [Rhodospirillales bacterium]